MSSAASGNLSFSGGFISARTGFAELRREIPGITEKVLAQHLRELEADGIVARCVFATIPPRVEYSLTEYGSSLERALKGHLRVGSTPHAAHWRR
jgi:DNA-binding HxlR family transcriptional regulator